MVAGIQQERLRKWLAQVDRHISASNAIIRRQREIIKRKEKAGVDPSVSLSLLKTFLDTQSLYVRHREQIVSTLREQHGFVIDLALDDFVLEGRSNPNPADDGEDRQSLAS